MNINFSDIPCTIPAKINATINDLIVANCRHFGVLHQFNARIPQSIDPFSLGRKHNIYAQFWFFIENFDPNWGHTFINIGSICFVSRSCRVCSKAIPRYWTHFKFKLECNAFSVRKINGFRLSRRFMSNNTIQRIKRITLDTVRNQHTRTRLAEMKTFDVFLLFRCIRWITCDIYKIR